MNLLLLLSVLTLTAVTFADEGDYNNIDHNHDAEEYLVIIKQLVTECGKELSLGEDILEMIITGNIIEGVEQYNCLLKCMLGKLKFINEKGEVQLHNYHDIIGKNDPIKEAMVQCRHIVVDTCDDALTLEKCMKSSP